MPFPFTYDKEKNLVYGAIVGTITFPDLKALMHALTESEEFQPDVNALWDLKNLDFSTMDADFERQMIAVRQQYPKRGRAKTAFLAEDDLAFGMTRMFQTMSSILPQEIMVFRTLAEAEKWLLTK